MVDNVNDRQVGGEHYAAEYQHWDFVTDVHLGYHAGNASKYVARWRKKNGRQDLEKALHYAEKCAQLKKAGDYFAEAYAADFVKRVLAFAVANSLDAADTQITMLLVFGDYSAAIQALTALLEKTCPVEAAIMPEVRKRKR